MENKVILSIKKIGRFFKSTPIERKIHKKYDKDISYLKHEIIREQKSEMQKEFENDLAIVCIMKNEGTYLSEWIAYHIIKGVDKFYLYDHESIDNTKEVLKPFIEKGYVEYNYIETPKSKLHHPQKEMYTDAVAKHRKDCKWMAFIDVDEYIVTEDSSKSITDVVENIIRKQNNCLVAGVGINWLTYGSSFYKTRPKGLIIENYIRRSKDEYEANQLVKTICNPRKIIAGDIHQPVYYDGFYNINEKGKVLNSTDRMYNSHELIRINHYASKSEEEANERSKRRFGGSSMKRNSHDINDVEDTVILPMVEEVKSFLVSIQDYYI